MVLVCNKPEAAGFVLESLEKLDWRDRQPRLASMRGRFPIDRPGLLGSTEWREASERINRLNAEVEL
jgi:hypothetical protein